jgi:hypothetical protein
MRQLTSPYSFCLQLLAALVIPAACFGAGPVPKDLNTWTNNIPPRLQWEANFGYCGEVSLISAGLYYGQYLSQYDARAIQISDGNTWVMTENIFSDEIAAYRAVPVFGP